MKKADIKIRKKKASIAWWLGGIKINNIEEGDDDRCITIGE